MFSQFNPREVASAAKDSIALAFGLDIKHPHPIAQNLSLQDIALALGSLQRPDLVKAERKRELIANGISLGAFAQVIVDAGKLLVVQNYEEQAAHRKFCKVFEVKNFNPVDIPVLDGDLDLIEGFPSDWLTRIRRSPGVAGTQIREYSRTAILTRREIVNDHLGGLLDALAQLGSVAGRIESRLVAHALESNRLLDDGLPAFDLAGDQHNNVLALDLTGPVLGQAMAKLRNQRNSQGSLSDLAARHLIVSPGLEFMANQLLASLALNIQVTALSYLPEGRWYLIADPKIQPTVGTLKLAGHDQIRMNRVSSRDEDFTTSYGHDSIGFRVQADLGAELVSRFGIVRGGATVQPAVEVNKQWDGERFPKVDGFSA